MHLLHVPFSPRHTPSQPLDQLTLLGEDAWMMNVICCQVNLAGQVRRKLLHSYLGGTCKEKDDGDGRMKMLLCGAD